MVLGHAAGGQDPLHRPLGDGERLRFLALLVLLNHGAQLLLDRLDRVKGAVLPQGPGKKALERLPLLGCGHGGRQVEHRVHKFLPTLPNVPGVQQGAVKVGGPVLKGWEQKAHFRRPHQPIRGPVVKLPCCYVICQGRFRQLHRADAAQNIAEDGVGAVLQLLAVLAPEGHVIGVLCQENQVATFHM